MNVQPITLTGHTVALVPLAREHAAELCAAADTTIFAYIGTRPAAIDVPSFEAYLDRLLATANMVPFAVIDRASGQAVGVTTYMDIRPNDLGLEIGSTWIGRAFHGTTVNPECKFLLLRHAFEQLGAVRVQLKTDLRNLQSQAAIAKLGAQREGILRKHLRVTEDYIRDTVMFSIIAEEWPAVREQLIERLAALNVAVETV